MGAEQSTEKRKKQDDENQKMIQGILRQQRQMYEEKCKELLQQQQLLQKAVTVATEEKPAKVTNLTKNYTTIYPNLQVPHSVNIQPSTSRASYNLTTNNVQMNTQSNASSSPKYNAANSIKPSTSGVSVSNSSSSSRASYLPSAPAPSTSNVALDLGARPKPRYDSAKPSNNNLNKCSTCGDSLGLKIYQCGQGHSSCMACKFKESYCGICRNPITDTRNIDVEKYLADLQLITDKKAIDCPNKIDGCMLSLKESNLEAHLKECPFREMACPVAFLYNGCTWRGKINQIKNHFLECHPKQTEADVDTELRFDPAINNLIVNHVNLGNFHFLVYMKTDSDFLYYSVQLIGSRISASKWTYELHIYNKSEPRRKYMYTDICVPSTDSFTDICKGTNCVVLPLRYAISYINDSKLTYKFFIKKYVNIRNDREVNRTDGCKQWTRRPRHNQNKKSNTQGPN